MGGLVGALINQSYQRTYPAATIGGVMEDALNIDALPELLKPIDWPAYTGAAENSLVFERKAPTAAEYKAIRAGSARNSASTGACYVELYIGKLTFSGGGIKSHLFGEFFARTYYEDVFTPKFAILWDQTRRLRVDDEQSRAEARENVRTGFLNAFRKFLDNKLPRPKPKA